MAAGVHIRGGEADVMTETTVAELAGPRAVLPMATATAPALAAAAGAAGEDGIAPAAVFSQQLCEVQLLIDFVSGNAARRLPDKAAAVAAGLDEDWIEKVCRISWPPAGSAAAQAEEEALLVKVKDYLNTLAAPASGASVAFTLLVAQEDNSRDAEDTVDDMAALRSGQSGRAFSRNSLARTAFPGLVDKARTFRRVMWYIGYGLGVWLSLTCLLSFYIALGNARIGQHRSAVETLAKLEAPALLAVSGTAASGGATGTNASTTDLTACRPPPATTAPRPSQCIAIDAARADATATRANVGAWLRSDPKPGAENAAILAATSWLDVLGGGVLPVFYGILGAGASVLRLLAGRMRLSLLMPRDQTLALQQLALGAVVGACIGLFVSPPGGDGANVLGTVSLSSSALSFIAGFGVEAVFATLEAVIARVFNVAPPPPPVRGS
ncbi:hypothetical protein IP88_11305 [alpha proteobacterium AAP81b]|nr:hypothetical protein IP88_11305 [alpha proteobacterium AAP81b]